MPGLSGAALTSDDVRRICGDIVDSRITAILSTGGTLEDLEEAVAWAGGLDDVMGEERKPLSGAAALIYEILVEDQEGDD